MFSLSFHLRPKPLFRLEYTVWALRRLPHNGIDRWNGSEYSRVLVISNNLVKVAVTQPDQSRIMIKAEASGQFARTDLKALIVSIIEKVLGIRLDLTRFYSKLAHDPRIVPLVNRFMGLKPPRFPSVFEAIINAAACQQLSLHVGIELLNRLANSYGRSWTQGREILHAFPLPEDLARATPLDLRAIGFSTNKADTIIALSRAIREGADLEGITAMSDAEAMDRLQQMKGIGRWSAEYVMLRGLGRTHIFPGDDVGARQNLKLLLRLKERPDYRQIRILTRDWRPYAGLLYFHFLLKKLQDKGYLPFDTTTGDFH